MHTVKEKISNMFSSVMEHVNIGKAKAEEKVENAAARTEEEKKLAHEHKKAKESRAKMELHQDKVRHAEERLRPQQPQYMHGYGYDREPPVGTAPPMAEATDPTYNLAVHPPTHSHKKY